MTHRGGGRQAQPPRRSAPPRTGAVPDPRGDPISAIWAISVVGIFVLIFVLALFGIPSRLFPAATPQPLPSFSLPVPTFSPGPALSPTAPASPLLSPAP